MTSLKILRAVAPLAILIGTQLGLFFVLRELFAPRPEHARRRRLIGLTQLALMAGVVVIYATGKSGGQLPGIARWLAQPVMASFMLTLPVLLLLGLMLSLAQRLPHKPSPPAHAPELADGGLPPLSEGRRIFLARAATGLFGGAAVLSAAGIYESEAPPHITRLDVPIKDLHPDLEGLTILQLSDVHAGMLMTEERMARIAALSATLAADVVVFTGDLLDMSRKAAGPFARGFSTLHGKLGTFAIFGNHDYYAGAAAAGGAVRDAGAVLLRNSGARVERGKGSLYIGGVDDPATMDTAGSVDFAKALAGAAPEEPRVMLCHRPGLFPLCAKAGADLVLSGHTHGGQLALGRTLTPARLLGPYTMGYFRENGSQLFVHRGLGVVGGMPLRLGSPPELALLTLRRS